MPIINKGIFNVNSIYTREVGNDWPTAQIVTTTDIIEGSNLYFTNLRVYAPAVQAVTPLLTTANVVETTNQYFANAKAVVAVTPLLTTANVVETTNQYFTNAKVITAITPVLTTANVNEYGNLYFTIPRVFSALSYANLALNNLTLIGDLEVLGNVVTLNIGTLNIEDKNILLANGATNAAAADGAGITIAGAQANIVYQSTGDKFVVNKTLDVVIGEVRASGNLIANGLIIRNISVSDQVLAGNITGTSVTGANILADSVTANIWNRLYTANVVETSGNLYFTTQRARDSFSAGENITITDGIIAASSTAIVANDSTTILAQADTLSYSMGRSISDPNNVLVVIEGLLQLPVTDYGVTGSTITFTSQPPVGSNIEVRFFGSESFSTSYPTLVSTIDSFVGNGSNVNYTLSTAPAGINFISVIIDGVFQQINTYTLSGKTLILSEAPSANADIDVRIISGPVGGQYNTRTFIGNSTTNTFVVSSGFTQDSILVFENGIAQVPTTDYTYEPGELRFVTPPATNVVIHVRELSTAGPNLIAAIRGVDIVTGNLVPIADVAYNLGSPTRKYKTLYLSANTIFLGNSSISINDNSIAFSSSGQTATLAVQGRDQESSNIIPVTSGISTLGSDNKKYKTLYLEPANSLVIGNTTIGVTGTSLSVSSPIKLKSYSTIDLNSLTGSVGDIVFNTTVATVQYYNGESWANIGASASGGSDNKTVGYALVFGG